MLLLKERRAAKRLHVNLPIAYSYSFDLETVSKSGSTCDLGDSGLCFYSDNPLNKGLNLRIDLKHIWDNPKDSVVVWCSRTIHHLYKVGVSFQ